MRALFRRFKHESVSPLEEELLAARPQPPARLVHSIVALFSRSTSSSRPSRLRLGYAGALTAALVAVLAATGGFAYAASAVQRAAHAVHLSSSKPAAAAPASASSACSQYAVAPVVSGLSPSSGLVGSSVTISGSHFSGNSAVTSVTFGGGVAATFSVSGDTSITATVPSGAQTGAITVANCKGSASTGTFTVTPPPPATHTLSVTDSGSGSGSVTSSPSGISCGSTCSASFNAGTAVSLTATAASGSTFAGWSGACSGTSSCSVTMSSDQSVTATFNTKPTPPPKKECVVPNVKGKSVGAARSAIARANCGEGKITKVKSSKKNKNKVISQSPGPGKHLPKGSKVNLTVGK